MRGALYFFLGFFVVTIIGFATSAQDLPLEILVSVQDLKSESKELTKKICNQVSETNLAQVSFRLTCTSVPTFDLSNEKVSSLLKEKSYQYHVEVLNLSSGKKIEVVTHNLVPFDSLDFKKVSNFYFGNENELIDMVTNHINQVARFYDNRFATRRQIVQDFAQFSSAVKIDLNTRQLFDLQTGNPLSWRQAYEILSFETTEHEKIARALIEISAVLGFSSYQYYRYLVVNQTDFDYDNFGNKINATVKSTNGWTFDTNKQNINSGHAFAGAVYYQTARSNGLSALKSFAITQVSSLFWEILGERKEKASINDQIITAVGGSIIGEAGFQIARAIRRKSNSVLAKSFAFVLDPSSGYNRLINKLSGNRDQFLEDLSSQQISEMETYISQSLDESQSKTLGFKASLINIEGYGQDGEATGIVMDTATVKAVAEVTKNKMSEVELKLITSVAWAAFYKKKIQNQEGYEFMTSFSSEFEYDKKTYPVDDFNLTVHLFGPQIQVNGYINGFKLSADVAVYADFAMINSLALAAYDHANPNKRQGLQSIIRDQGYYFGFGLTDKIRFALSKANWSAFVEAQRSHLTSKNGWDRFQSTVTKDINYSDTKKTTAIGLSVDVLKNLRLTLKQERVSRNSLIEGGYNGQYKIKRNWVQLEYKW